VLLAGGGLGNAVLFSIGAGAARRGSKVLYFAGYKKVIDRYKVDEIEAAADVGRLVLRRGARIRAARPQDRTFVGNIVQAMVPTRGRARRAADPARATPTASSRSAPTA
jgi:hypothetical protein